MKNQYTTHGSPLPFPEWMEKTYPKKTPARSFLQMIGALDLAYLMYRVKAQKEQKVQPIPSAPNDAKPVVTKSAPTKTPAKKSVKTKGPTPVKKTATDAPKMEKEELTIEFEHKPEPIKTQVCRPADTASKIKETPIEPEPLVLQEEPGMEKAPMDKPVKKQPSKMIWLDDESIEDMDLRKVKSALGINGIGVAFETLYGDEEETAIIVNDVSWRALLTSPALNLSKMVQTLRVSYGEVYVLGRMALGAMSGEGYVSTDECTRIIETLAATQSKTIDLDVRYHDKDSTSKKRTAHTIRIRFERV